MGECRSCRHFIDDPQALERIFVGLLALSSGQGSTRGDQGLCTIHDRFLTARATCASFAEREGE